MIKRTNHEGGTAITTIIAKITMPTADTTTFDQKIRCELCGSRLPRKAFVCMTSRCTHEAQHCLFCVVIFVGKLLGRYKPPPSLRYSSREKKLYSQNEITIDLDGNVSSKEAIPDELPPGLSSSHVFTPFPVASSGQLRKICCMHGSCDEILSLSDIALFSTSLSTLPDVIKTKKLCPICAENRSKRYDFRPLPLRCHRRLRGLNNLVPNGLIMSNVCVHCISMHISTQVRTSRNSAVSCLCVPSSSSSPNPRYNQFQCPYVYTRDDISAMKLADKNVLHDLDDLLSQEAIERMPGFVWCPFQSCGSGQIHDSINGNRMICEGCKRVSCVRHHIPWHEGRTCEEYERHLQTMAERQEWDSDSVGNGDGYSGRIRLFPIQKRVGNTGGAGPSSNSSAGAGNSNDLQEVMLRSALAKHNVKECPKCGHGVQKNGGCDHVRSSIFFAHLSLAFSHLIIMSSSSISLFQIVH